MSQGPLLRSYLQLERIVEGLSAAGREGLADGVRDAMDPIWHLLTDDERRSLNRRVLRPAFDWRGWGLLIGLGCGPYALLLAAFAAFLWWRP